MNFRDKVCLITGASSGIGKQMAFGVARRGGKVALVSRRGEILEEIAGKIWQEGGSAAVFAVDVADPRGTNDAVDQVVQRWGRLDVTIANAGVGILRSAANLAPEQVEEMVRVNLLGAMHVLLPSLRVMLGQGEGHLVGVSSLGGFRGLPRSAVYSATKSGLNSFLESLRIEYGHKGIKVSCVCPGFVKTPMTAGSKQPMPFLMTAEQAGERVLRAVEKEKSVALFPLPLACIVRLVNWMPNRVYDALLRSTQPKDRA